MNEPTNITTKKPGSRGLKIAGLSISALIMVAAIGYSAYAWQQNQTLQADTATKTAQISKLTQEIGALKAVPVSTPTPQPPAAPTQKPNENVITIKELGISITVPDSIKDITYAYGGFGPGSAEMVNLSTKALTDKSPTCRAYGTSPPLGGLSKVAGTYVKGAPHALDLVKQFKTYYIGHSSPHAVCDLQADILPKMNAFKQALATAKEL